MKDNIIEYLGYEMMGENFKPNSQDMYHEIENDKRNVAEEHTFPWLSHGYPQYFLRWKMIQIR